MNRRKEKENLIWIMGHIESMLKRKKNIRISVWQHTDFFFLICFFFCSSSCISFSFVFAMAMQWIRQGWMQNENDEKKKTCDSNQTTKRFFLFGLKTTKSPTKPISFTIIYILLCCFWSCVQNGQFAKYFVWFYDISNFVYSVHNV